MNSRKLIALFLVFALTGSALAVQQQRTYRGSDDGDLEAASVTGVQQHSVFIEIVIEKDRQDVQNQIHEFAAVVGLIKECKSADGRNAFDNAVLWFNDQFLFGEKRSNQVGNVTNNSSGDILGVNPEGNAFIGDDGNPGRWGGCYSPDGFANAIGGDDPFGTVSVNTSQGVNASSDDVLGTASLPDDNMDIVKEMISLDNTCQGCIFEYQSSFFVVDPNDHRWIVDKYVYPLSVMGNFFASGAGDNCGDSESDESVAPFSDPRERDSPFANQHHADRCEDDNANDAENHCYDDSSTTEECDGSGDDRGILTDNSTLVEPLFSSHLQINPQTGMGFADKASFQVNETTVRDGAPYTDPCSVQTWECAIEYNFLLAVDFAAFDDRSPADATNSAGIQGENEIDRGCAVEHGQGGADNSTTALQGNSHPHNPNTTTMDPGPAHCHPTVNLDIFYSSSAPYFTEQHQYWTDDHGTPLAWTSDCETAEGTPTDGQDASAIEQRTPIVCDYDSDAGEFHAHDGSQTPNPS